MIQDDIPNIQDPTGTRYPVQDIRSKDQDPTSKIPYLYPKSKAPTVSEDCLALVDGNLLLLEGEVKVHVHGLGMSNVKVAVRLRGETGTDLTQTERACKTKKVIKAKVNIKIIKMIP